MRESVTRAEEAGNTEASDDTCAPTRRDFFTKYVGIPAGFGLVLGMGERAKSIAKMHRAAHDVMYRFGTIDNPVFKVTTSLPFAKLETYKARIQGNGHDLSPELVKRGDATVRTLSDLLNDEVVAYRESMKSDAQSLVDRKAAHERLCSMLSAIDTQSRAILRPLNADVFSVVNGRVRDTVRSIGLGVIYEASSVKSFKAKAEKRGPPDVFIRGIVKKLTGRDLPDQIRLEVRPLDREDIIGSSNFVSGEVVVKDRAYEGVVATFAHEVGHIISMHEEAFVTGRGSALRTSKDVYDWEEACAYAFEASVVSYLATTDLEDRDLARNLFFTQHRYLTADYYTGREVTECHRVGMVYFDAALTVLGSPGAAYNYLSSHTELTPAMLAVIEANKNASKVDFTGRKHLHQRVTALLQRIKETREQYKTP